MLTDAQIAALIAWVDPETDAQLKRMYRDHEDLTLHGFTERAARGLVRERNDPDLWIGTRAAMAEAGLSYQEV